MAHGKNGTLTFANGNMYKGGFDNNKFHGKGDYTYSPGNNTEGDSEAKVGDIK